MATVKELEAILAGGPSAAANWQQCSTLAFDACSIPEDDLVGMTLRLIVMHDLHEMFQVDAELWFNFIAALRKKMHPNPYHNFQHVCDVTQTASAVLFDPKIRNRLEPVEKFCVILSSLLHDLDHPGKNNAYQVNASTELAIVYNDMSVLENHHSAMATRLMKETNILRGVPAEQMRKLRTSFVDNVLATDMTKHFAISGELNGFINDEKRMETFGPTDRQLVVKSILHFADISNPAKEWAMSKEWSDRVSEEFLAQGDCEKDEGLAVSPMCDRTNTFQDESSLGFCDFIVAPYLYNVAAIAPNVLLPACKQLADNRDKWQAMLEERFKAAVGEGEGKDAELEEKLKPWMGKSNAFNEKFNEQCGKIAASMSA